MKNIFMFPGQGSQKEGMGQDLFSLYPDLVNQASSLLGYSLADLCLGALNQSIDQTQYTQPALYCVNALYAKNFYNKGIHPDLLMGHSLGEYNALLESGVFDFGTGLLLVKKRGELMSKAKNGIMISIIGLTIDDIRSILEKEHLDHVDIASHNSKRQCVLSSKSSDLSSLKTIFKKEKAKRIIPLKVSGAFHSRYMKQARSDFEKFLKQFSFQKPKIPVLANRNANFYGEEGNDIIKNLSQQLTEPVLWFDSMMKVNDKDNHFFEVGPGKVLKGLLKRLLF